MGLNPGVRRRKTKRQNTVEEGRACKEGGRSMNDVSTRRGTPEDTGSLLQSSSIFTEDFQPPKCLETKCLVLPFFFLAQSVAFLYDSLKKPKQLLLLGLNIRMYTLIIKEHKVNHSACRSLWNMKNNIQVCKQDYLSLSHLTNTLTTVVVPISYKSP